MLLLLLYLLQHRHDGVGHGDDPASAVLRRDERILAADLFALLELLVDIERLVLKIHAVPGQPQHFALPQTGKERHLVQMLILVPADCLEKHSDVRKKTP